MIPEEDSRVQRVRIHHPDGAYPPDRIWEVREDSPLRESDGSTGCLCPGDTGLIIDMPPGYDSFLVDFSEPGVARPVALAAVYPHEAPTRWKAPAPAADSGRTPPPRRRTSRLRYNRAAKSPSPHLHHLALHLRRHARPILRHEHVHLRTHPELRHVDARLYRNRDSRYQLPRIVGLPRV